jgi:diphthamide synthase (EF-2-diphthine--ammonia ligase)
VIDAPIFKKRILIEDADIVWKEDSGYLKINKLELVGK